MQLDGGNNELKLAVRLSEAEPRFVMTSETFSQMSTRFFFKIEVIKKTNKYTNCSGKCFQTAARLY